KASAPPDKPVPAPRGVNGTPARLSSRITSAVSSVDLGKTTARGRYLCCGRPSHSYTSNSASSASTPSRPTIAHRFLLSLSKVEHEERQSYTTPSTRKAGSNNQVRDTISEPHWWVRFQSFMPVECGRYRSRYRT